MDQINLITNPEPETKTCIKCNVTKPISEFYISRQKGKTVNTCKECSKKKQSEYVKANRGVVNLKKKERRAKNPDKYNAMSREFFENLRIETIKVYGGKCNCCGETLFDLLAIDHAHNNGEDHRKKIGKDGRAVYRWLKKFNFPQDGRFQLLCHNCNMSKGMYGGCPHKGKPPGKRTLTTLWLYDVETDQPIPPPPPKIEPELPPIETLAKPTKKTGRKKPNIVIISGTSACLLPKTCANCEIEKQPDEFYQEKNENYTNGIRLSSWCRDCYSEKRRIEWANHKEYLSRKNREYRNSDKEKIANQELRDEVIKEYGGKCVCCGNNYPEHLGIDHINNDGNKHRKELKGYARHIMRWLKKEGFPKDNYQLMCHNCNISKKRYGVCAHKVIQSKDLTLCK